MYVDRGGDLGAARRRATEVARLLAAPSEVVDSAVDDETAGTQIVRQTAEYS